jgi:glycosyltransferase involved in cell wall biosynthesis
MQERRKIQDRRKRETKHGLPEYYTRSHIPALRDNSTYSENVTSLSQTVVTDPDKSIITILLCAYNEAGILTENLQEIDKYLSDAADKYRWEIVIVNDGSSDDTGVIAEEFAASRPYVRVIHHPGNRGLGQATISGIAASSGDYVVTLDVDLSYDVNHITLLLDELVNKRVQMVLASPYMSGGTISHVPALRKYLSIAANKFLAFFAHTRLSTITCMVRAFEGDYIRSMDLRAVGMEIMPEVVYKSMILRARVHEIPAHLDWERQRSAGVARQSSMRILRHILATVHAGFFFRPFMFMVLPGLFVLIISVYANVWGFIHLGDAYGQRIAAHGSSTLTQALDLAFSEYPHTYVIGLLTLVISILLIGLAIVLLQSKIYFEDLYHLNSSQKYRRQKDA